MTNPVTIIIDSREQKPLDFQPYIDDGIAYETGTLRTGDYSVAGYEQCVAIERKSLDDLIGTLLNGYEADTRKPPKRFNRELQRMQHFDRSVILVEDQEMSLWSRQYRSLVNPRSIWGMLMGVYATWGIPFYFTGSRAQSARWIADFARHYVVAREKKFFLPEERKSVQSDEF